MGLIFFRNPTTADRWQEGMPVGKKSCSCLRTGPLVDEVGIFEV